MKFFELLEDLDPNRNNVLVTSLDPEEPGEKLLISDGKCVWSSGGSCLEALQERLAAENRTGALEIEGHRFFVESLGRQKSLVICGGGHIAMPLVTIGRLLDLSVTVIEDRPEFAENARKQGASEVILDDFTEALKRLESSEDTYFVIITRGHRHDKECLETILKKRNAYIGMIGSRRKVALVKEKLIEEGFAREKVEAVYTPIGLKIGAETPAEIAVSIMAEIIQVKNAGRNSSGYSTEIKRAIRGLREAGQKAVLATIVGSKGSAPREMGAKMLIRQDGTIAGTIGGGLAEADVIRLGLEMIKDGEEKPRLVREDMTASGSPEEMGMVCGGIQDILMEIVN